MREIKFRAKRKDNGDWVYGYLAESCYGMVILPIGKDPALYHVDGCEWNVIEHTVIPETVGQFTGLKDKNGKEIYEGDIIFVERESKDHRCNCEDRNNQVIWVNDFATFGTHLDIVIDWVRYCNKIEVIGNIYENPELVSTSNSN